MQNSSWESCLCTLYILKEGLIVFKLQSIDIFLWYKKRNTIINLIRFKLDRFKLKVILVRGLMMPPTSPFFRFVTHLSCGSISKYVLLIDALWLYVNRTLRIVSWREDDNVKHPATMWGGGGGGRSTDVLHQHVKCSQDESKSLNWTLSETL